MSRTKAILKQARAKLLSVGNDELDKRAHALWDIEASGDGKITVNNRAAKEDDDDSEQEEAGEAEVEVSMEAEPMQELPLPLEQGQLVMFVLGGRQFTGSVLYSDNSHSIVQTGVRKYRVENDFLYKISQAGPLEWEQHRSVPDSTPPQEIRPPLRDQPEPTGVNTPSAVYVPSEAAYPFEIARDGVSPTPPGMPPSSGKPVNKDEALPGGSDVGNKLL